jgi:hypothetical protein
MLEIAPGLDPWDPNNWSPSTHEHRIYADETLEVYAVVDAIDYPYLSQFKWSIHDRKKAARGFVYLRRTTHEYMGPSGGLYESPITGALVRDKKRIQGNKFLHTEIMERTGIPKPTPKHNETDHRDRNTLNCRRINLIWATRSMNVLNTVNPWALRRHGKTSTSILL